MAEIVCEHVSARGTPLFSPPSLPGPYSTRADYAFRPTPAHNSPDKGFSHLTAHEGTAVSPALLGPGLLTRIRRDRQQRSSKKGPAHAHPWTHAARIRQRAATALPAFRNVPSQGRGCRRGPLRETLRLEGGPDAVGGIGARSRRMRCGRGRGSRRGSWGGLRSGLGGCPGCAVWVRGVGRWARSLWAIPNGGAREALTVMAIGTPDGIFGLGFAAHCITSDAVRSV